jgi:hypothetical protein
MKEHGGHEDLRGLGHQSVIPYVHGEWELYYSVQFKRWLGSFRVGVPSLLILAFSRAFYSSRAGSYNETQGPTGDPGAGKTLCSMALMARSSE